jgi:hypothetical protein
MKVQVRAVKDIPKIELVGRDLGPFVQGQELELEPWQSEVLGLHGLVEPIQKLTLSEMKKFLFAEGRTASLGQLPPNFYSMLREKAVSLIALKKFDELDEFRRVAESLVEARLPKLLKLLPIRESLDIPPEEKYLLNRLAKTLNGWTEWLGSFFKVEEEVSRDDFGGTV